MRIIQLPPVISTRGNTPPSSKPNGTSSSPNSSSSSSNNNKHFLIIPSRRLTDNNNSRKTNGQNGSIPTCERLDRRGIRTFVGHAQETKPEETVVSSNCRSVMTSYGGRFKDSEADKENSTPEGDCEEEETNVRMSPGHVRNMIALFSSGSPNDLDSRSRSKSPEWEKGASPQPVTNGKSVSIVSKNCKLKVVVPGKIEKLMSSKIKNRSGNEWKRKSEMWSILRTASFSWWLILFDDTFAQVDIFFLRVCSHNNDVYQEHFEWFC